MEHRAAVIGLGDRANLEPADVTAPSAGFEGVELVHCRPAYWPLRNGEVAGHPAAALVDPRGRRRSPRGPIEVDDQPLAVDLGSAALSWTVPIRVISLRSRS